MRSQRFLYINVYKNYDSSEEANISTQETMAYRNEKLQFRVEENISIRFLHRNVLQAILIHVCI